nr:uncharacterized protein LOC112801040 isoform X1 [Arachis hypogaea]
MQRVAVKAKRLEFYMCLVKRALRKLVTEQNALGLNQIYIYIQVLILSFQDILKKAQLLFPRVMVVDSIQTLDPISTASSFPLTLLTLFFFYHLPMSFNLTFCFDLCILQWSEQNVKLNDVEHKLKDQGRQLKKMSLGQALVMMTMIT